MIGNLDIGSGAVPAFGDLDGDGDFDLLIGRGDGLLSYFENTGTRWSPLFELVTDSFLNSDFGNNTSPELADLDDDGDLDLLLGRTPLRGLVEYWRNEGTPQVFDFVKVTAGFPVIQVDDFANPRVCDIDDDGLLDLLVGEFDGNARANVLYFKNIGAKNNPVLVLAEPKLLDHVFRLTTGPAPYDWDNDGKIDLIVGGDGFGYTFYRNTAPPGQSPDSISLVKMTDTLPGFDDGYRLSMVFVDIDSDGDDDIFVGEEDGGLNFYRKLGVGYVRGDVDLSGAINQADIVAIINFTLNSRAPDFGNPDAADVNCNATVDIGDIIYLINFLFGSGAAPCAN